MDRDVIDQKLESLRRCLQRIQTKCPPDANLLVTDFDLQDIVSLNLSRAVQLSVDIGAHIIAQLDVQAPGTMGQTFDLLSSQGVVSRELANQLKKAVGFRNISVHNYDAIDWHIVHSIAHDHLADFSEFAKAIMTWLGKNRG